MGFKTFVRVASLRNDRAKLISAHRTPVPPMTQKFATSAQTATLFSISRSTLKKWRLGLNQTPACLQEGIHWIRLDGGDVRFNVSLMEDFYSNKINPGAHEKAIENYLRSLPSSQ